MQKRSRSIVNSSHCLCSAPSTILGGEIAFLAIFDEVN